MKKKLLIISAVAGIIFVSASAFSQNVAPVNNTSSTPSQKVHIRVKPVSALKTTTTPSGNKSAVRQSSTTMSKTVHAHIKPVSTAKQPAPVQSSVHPNTTATNTVHVRVKPVTVNKSTSTGSSNTIH